jgi:nucleotide-binding universal stress UspA family protein
MKRFENILCVLGPDEESEATLERAVALAENNQSQLTVVEVIPAVTAGIGMPDGGPISVDLQAAMKADRMQTLESFTRRYEKRVKIGLDVLMGTGFLQIIRSVLRNGHDLVIKAAENPNFIERLFGSDDMHLLRKCPCPLWLTKPGDKPNYSCILAAVDVAQEESDIEHGDLNRRILEIASSLALSDFAALHLVHAWDAPGEMTVRAWGDDPDSAAFSYVEGERSRRQRGLDQLRDQLKGQLGAEAYGYLSPRFHLQRGAASNVVPESAKELQADLVVMGTVARTGISGLFIGNTAEAILEQVRCSVLAIKPSGFVSPVKLAE